MTYRHVSMMCEHGSDAEMHDLCRDPDCDCEHHGSIRWRSPDGYEAPTLAEYGIASPARTQEQAAQERLNRALAEQERIATLDPIAWRAVERVKWLSWHDPEPGPEPERLTFRERLRARLLA